MIVTRSWLSEFIDLDGISNETLYETFNAIGLEVGLQKMHKQFVKPPRLPVQIR
jgi:phenylalanyl-tRNA synthetase beta chain